WQQSCPFARRADVTLSTPCGHQAKTAPLACSQSRRRATMSEPLEDLSERGLLAANQYQRRILGAGDERAIARLLHPNFIINGPQNICGGRDQILRLSHGGALSYENCQTRIEKISLTGNVGILMGDETVTPAD